jgi:hypothetical protein
MQDVLSSVIKRINLIFCGLGKGAFNAGAHMYVLLVGFQVHFFGYGW